MVSIFVIHVNAWISAYLLAPQGWKAELADQQRTVYPQTGHLSITDLAQNRESPPAKDRHPNR